MRLNKKICKECVIRYIMRCTGVDRYRALDFIERNNPYCSIRNAVEAGKNPPDGYKCHYELEQLLMAGESDAE